MLIICFYENILKNEIVSVKKPSVLNEKELLEQEIERHRINEQIVNLKEEIQKSEKYDATDDLIDPIEFCPQKRISEQTIEKLLKLVKLIDEQHPTKNYYDIFSLRYIKRLNQTEIARTLKISQVELSKRFVELIKLVKDNT